MSRHSYLYTPILFIVSSIILWLFLKDIAPGSEKLVQELAALYGRYGYEIIFLGAMLEALVLVNIFVPGIFALAFGAVFARAGELDLSVVIIVATLGALVGFLIDFTLGYFGFGQLIEEISSKGTLSRLKKQLKRSYFKTFFLGYFHPNLGSVVSLVAGALKINILSFLLLSTFSTLAWLSLWGISVFLLGDIFLMILVKYFYVLVLFIISIWILIILYEYNKK